MGLRESRVRSTRVIRAQSAHPSSGASLAAHQPTRLRERVMRRFKSAASAQRFMDAFTRVGTLFRPRRHLLTAGRYRATMRERVAIWRQATGVGAA